MKLAVWPEPTQVHNSLVTTLVNLADMRALIQLRALETSRILALTHSLQRNKPGKQGAFGQRKPDWQHATLRNRHARRASRHNRRAPPRAGLRAQHPRSPTQAVLSSLPHPAPATLTFSLALGPEEVMVEEDWPSASALTLSLSPPQPFHAETPPPCQALVQ